MKATILETLIKFVKLIKDYFLIAVIALLLIFIYFKNIKIENLNAKLEELPKVEYVYNTIRDTIPYPKPYPVEVIKWNNTVDTLYVPLDLNGADSSEIAKAYKDLFTKFAETKIYNNVLYDDSTAFIQLLEEVQYNTIKDRELVFQDKTPTVYVTTTKPVYTTSIVGGIEAGTTGVELGAGLITKRNTFVKVSYDPFNKTVRGGVYFSIFNIKSK